MAKLSGLIKQLKKERDRLDRAIKALTGAGRAQGGGGKRTLSLAARKKIAAAQRARWAKFRAKKKA